MGKRMTPSQKAKELGCKNLLQVADKTGQSEQTLINWFKNPKKRVLFEIVCKGVAYHVNPKVVMEKEE